jgi:predicted RNA-binding Zn-ribbon protein involved in translation (DUF1610 family)
LFIESIMSTNKRYRCPGCGFAVFNRRVAHCESCGAALPAEFGFSAKDLALLDAEHERIAKQRNDLAKEEEEAHRKRLARRGSGG